MVAVNGLKSETVSLIEQRDGIEQEMNDIIARLCRPGGPGISGNLVDQEGFPRADIDVMAVRSDRQRLSELRNDHKRITGKIEGHLQILHSKRVHGSSQFPSNSSVNDGMVIDSAANDYASSDSSSNHGIAATVSSAMDLDPIARVPFAVIDEISDESPAAEDGLQLGDQIVKFGNVQRGLELLLPKLSVEAQSNEGKSVPVAVLRQGSMISLSVMPRSWNGRGLLGCHFRLI